MPEPSRRRFLRKVAATAAAGGVAAASPSAALAATVRQHPDRKARTRVVILGTAGGPTYMPGGRYGVSTAVVYGDRVYIIDLGLGAYQRLVQSGLGPDTDLAAAATNVRGVFFTHLHSDHTLDWPSFYLTASANDIGRSGAPIEVFGPGARDTLPQVLPPGRPDPHVVSPADPAPGIRKMSGHLQEAFAQDLNDRVRATGFTPPDTMFNLHDIDVSDIWTVDPAGVPPRLSSPIPVWTDGDVRVTATLVDHRPTAPAFAFRFDTPDGSVVVSGDTTVSENLIDLAAGADYLVHEVIDEQYVETLVAALPADRADALRARLLGTHTTIAQVGRDVAERAGVKNLVLSHLVPASNPERRWRQAQRGFSGNLVVGHDLMDLPVGGRRS
ncbi:MBL fold metallo-hydrolase [Streptomyces sp. NPDC049954]|uniref:MBL fold metallo-hydrolase n=1 Tax=Streptomyces sp. NPDC049954 TaxID=3155779 RepID=UPI003425D6A4